MSAAARLYTPEMLGLATVLADYPLSADLALRGNARSAACGSTLELGAKLDQDAKICKVGVSARACAVGQAAAALFVQAAVGRTGVEITRALDQLSRWLDHGGQLPDWPGLELLEPARAVPGRHGAILLAWRAASQALSTSPAAR